MERYNNTIQDSSGNIVTTATVTVYLSSSGSFASIYDDDESTLLSNPFTISNGNYDAKGSFWFKAANSLYDIKIVNGLDTTWIYDETLFDVSDTLNATITLKSYYTVADKTAAKLLTVSNNHKVFLLGDDGGSFTMKTGASIGTYTDDSVLSPGTRFSAGDGSTGFIRDNIYALNVQWYGALCDSTTNNITAFNEAKTRAKLPSNNGHSAIYIPGGHDRKYYRIDSVFTVDTDSIRLYGDGLTSLIVQHDSGGANCITVSGNAHRCQIQDIAIMGVVGSGHGIEITSTSHYGEISNVYIGYMGGVGLRVTSGQSWVHKNVSVDQNGAYSPTTIVGATAGNCTMGIEVAYNSSGNTNNQSFINCKINGIGVDATGNYALKVGDASNPVGITMFSWIGGVIQGTSNNELVYIKCDEPKISNTHFESTTTSSEYILTVDTCRGFGMNQVFCLGDINLTGANKFLTISNITGVGGISISSTTQNSSIKDLVFRSNVSGPTSGNIQYTGGGVEFDNVTSLNGDHYLLPGEQLSKNAGLYFGSAMETWLGGGTPTVPCGFDKGGGGTVTRDTTTIRNGTYSCKIVYTATNTQGLRLNIRPLNSIQAKKITVVAWAYTTAGVARIHGLESGSTSYFEDSQTTGAWEKITATFRPISSATSFRILFTAGNSTSTIYWDSINIYIEDHTPVLWKSDAAGALNISVDNTTEAGYPIPLVFASGTTTITAINGAHVGIPYTLYFDSAKTVNNTSTIKLAGAANFAATADDTLTLVLCDDGVNREIARSVN